MNSINQIVTNNNRISGPYSERSSGILVQSRISDRLAVRLPLKKQEFKAYVYPDMVKLKATQRAELHGGGTRGRIRDFSRASRKRMLEKLAMIPTSPNYFLTLTYGDPFAATPETTKRHLANLRKWLQRNLPGSAAMWRIEFQTRKSGEFIGGVVPHFHILLWSDEVQKMRYWLKGPRKWLTGLPAAQRLLRDAWRKIVGYAPLNSEYHRTEWKRIENRRHAGYYASKYAAKAPEVENLDMRGWGRVWGAFGDLNTAPTVVLTMTAAEATKYRRSVRKWLTRPRSAKQRQISAQSKAADKAYQARKRRQLRHLWRKSPFQGYTAFGLGSHSQEGTVWSSQPGWRMLYASLD